MTRQPAHITFRLALVTLALALAAAPPSMRAQAVARPTGAWVDLGLSAGAYATLGGAMAFTRVTPQRLWRVRMHAMGNDGWNSDPAREIRSLGELAVQVGRPIGPCGANWCGISGGLAYVESSKSDAGREEVDKHTVGLSGEVFLVSRNAPHLTAGLFANLNAVAPFAGFMLSVSLGRVPTVRR